MIMLDDRRHRALVALEHLPHRGNVGVDAEARDVLAHAPLGEPQRRDDREEVRAVPMRHAAVAEQDRRERPC